MHIEQCRNVCSPDQLYFNNTVLIMYIILYILVCFLTLVPSYISTAGHGLPLVLKCIISLYHVTHPIWLWLVVDKWYPRAMTCIHNNTSIQIFLMNKPNVFNYIYRVFLQIKWFYFALDSWDFFVWKFHCIHYFIQIFLYIPPQDIL